jgi:Relaxase/Mobilisation nuclease domain
MRPKIMPCHSIAKSLRYNEEKVSQGKAECLTAGNFLKDLSRLTFRDKLHCFEKRMELNERVTTNQHITLNFDPLDQLSNDQMAKIARLYMKEIGFERQPYLVYRHNDAGHPHCHIVTTHVRRDGSPIALYNIGRNQSEKARQRIEAEFGLVTAEMKRQMRQEGQQVDGIQKIKYGETSVARSLSGILDHVTKNYKCTSLPEFNAILRLYNVQAYRGSEDTQLYRNRGLLYRVLDDHGKFIGRPIKASFFDSKPTLDNLEKKFVLNQPCKLQLQKHVTTSIQWELLKNPSDLDTVIRNLSRQHIRMVLRRDKEGKCREVAYIESLDKCVYLGEELGRHCNAAAIQKVMDAQKALLAQQSLQQSQQASHQQSQEQRPRLRHYLG